jgi:hydroxymethylbilane synthase
LIKSLFISRNPEEVPELSEFCTQRNIRLSARPLIRFEAVPFSVKDEFSVIFFSSIRAAQFYLKENSLNPNCAVACIGTETAEKLRKMGIECQFIGNKAGDPESVALEFKKWLGDRKVLIPCSDRSNRSIAKVLSADQFNEVIVYCTISDPAPIDTCDVYIFSSPSNVEAFFEKNVLPEGSRVISWGKTTDKALANHGIVAFLTLQSSSTKEVLTWLLEQV